MTKKTKRGRDFCFPHLFITSFNLYNLFRITYCACLTDYCDLHLSRISHLILYLLRNFTGKVFSLLIVNLISTNNYTQLATCPDSIRLRHTRIGHCQLFQIVQTLDVSLNNFATCSRTAPEIASHTCTMGARRLVISTSSWWAPIALQISGFSLNFSASFIP